MSYRQRWLGFWVIVSATSVGLALLQWGWLKVAVAFALTEIAITLFIVVASEVPYGASQLSALTWRIAGIGAEIALGMVAFVVVANFSKAFALCLLVAAGASSPPMVSRLLRRMRSDGARAAYSQPSFRDPPHESAAAALPSVEVQELTTAERCHAWRRSFLLLGAASSILERSRIVGCRQQYLDELERRSPRGLRAWLASGARAAGSPERYIADDPGHWHPDAA
jgi:hypothetical protein